VAWAKKALEEVGQAFLKQQKESSSSSTIPEIGDDLEGSSPSSGIPKIVDDLEGRLFDNLHKPELPKMNLLLPYQYPGTPSGSFPVLM
jgi:hypothetical protein